MITRELTIQNQSGLHARPATLWVQTASRFKSQVRLKKAAKEVDGKSLLSILTLGLSVGSVVEMTLDGEDEQEAAAALENLLAELAAKGE